MQNKFLFNINVLKNYVAYCLNKYIIKMLKMIMKAQRVKLAIF